MSIHMSIIRHVNVRLFAKFEGFHYHEKRLPPCVAPKTNDYMLGKTDHVLTYIYPFPNKTGSGTVP